MPGIGPGIGLSFGRGPLNASKSVTGQILSEAFASTSGWTNDGTWAVDSTKPAYAVGDRSPTVVFTPSLNANTAGGIRENNILKDDDGVWYNYFGSSDGVEGWYVQMAKSTDRGANWTYVGDMGVKYRKQNDPAVKWAARDQLSVQKWNGIYYMQAMSASTVTGAIPGLVYESDLFTATNPAGPWTWQSRSCTSSGSGQDATSNYSSMTVLVSAGVYAQFKSITNAGPTVWQASYSLGSSPDGPWTESGVLLLPDGENCENPKVFYSAVLGKWCCAINRLSEIPGHVTDKNTIYYSDNPLNFRSGGAYRIDTQRMCPSDGLKAIGIASPFMTADGGIYVASNGSIPFTFDTDPPDSPADQNTGRTARYAVWEPSATRLRYNTAPTTLFSDDFLRADGAPGVNWTSFKTGDFTISSNKLSLGSAATDRMMYVTGQSIQNGTVSFELTADGNCGGGHFIRAADNNNFYLFDLGQGIPNGLLFYKCVAGSFTLLQTLTHAAFTGTTRLSVTFIGSTFYVYADGALVATWTDSTFSAAGKVGIRNGSAGTGSRLVDNYFVKTATSQTTNRYFKAATHTDCVAELFIEHESLPVGSCTGIEFRRQANGDCYRAYLNDSGYVQLAKIVSGVVTNLGTPSGTISAIVGFAHRLKIIAAGTALTAYLDGELQCSVTDSTFSSGASIGTFAKGADAAVRLLLVSTSNTITVTGLSVGQVVTLRNADIIPLQSQTAVGSSLTFSNVNHWPITGLDINGRDITVSGGVQGGDTLAVA